MKQILNQLFEHQRLSKSQAREVLTNISNEAYNDAQVAAFISVYLMRGISIDELRGFREALLELCIPIDLQGIESIDVCGTGGDGKNTFNISTLSAFVIAGAGYKVTKHGNYGVSSACGSSNVLEHLGYKFSNDIARLMHQLDTTNVCFYHAPLFHPALKSVGPIRRQLGVKTFFNMLGPIVNPAQPTHQMVGVFSLKLARLYQYLFEEIDMNYAIVHSLSGYDELSLTDDAKIVASNKGEYILRNDMFDLPTYQPTDIYGGETVEEAATIFKKVLSCESTIAQRDVVLANAALAIDSFKEESDLKASFSRGKRVLSKQKGFKCINERHRSKQLIMNILDKIYSYKKTEVEKTKSTTSTHDFTNSEFYHRTCNSLAAGIKQDEASGIIAEFKRKSPSKQAINLDAEVETVTNGYAQAGASAFSILTDQHFFGGKNEYLTSVRELHPTVPILRKDFIVDDYQIHEAKAIGADIILLICEILSATEVRQFTDTATSLGMEVLLELHSEVQLEKYYNQVSMVGVNNRDLSTFTVDFDRSKKLFDALPSDSIKISESGLKDAGTLHMLSEYGFDGFLIGEQFMKTSDPGLACKAMIDQYTKLRNVD